MYVTLIAVLAFVVVLVCSSVCTTCLRETYAGQSGVDWLEAAWATLAPGECVESGVVVDKLGARQGEYVYWDGPEDMSLYRELFGVNGALSPTDSADSLSSVAVVPTSAYADALTDMDGMSQRYRSQLLQMKPWFLPRGAPARFADLTSGLLDRVSVQAGVTVWRVKLSVRDQPRAAAKALLAFASYAKLLHDLDSATRDFKQIEGVVSVEDVLSSAVVSETQSGVATVTAAIDKERVLSEAQLWRAAETNATETAVVRDRGLALAHRAGDDSAAAKAAAAAAAALDLERRPKDAANVRSSANLTIRRGALDALARGTASLVSSTGELVLRNETDLATARDLIASYTDERDGLARYMADLDARIGGLQKEISYYSSPDRLFAGRTQLFAATEELHVAMSDLQAASDAASRATANQSALQTAVDEQTAVTDGATESARAAIAAAQAQYDVLSKTRGRLAASQNFVKTRDALQMDLDGAEASETAAKAKLDGALATASASDSLVKSVSCPISDESRRGLSAPLPLPPPVVAELAPVANPAASCYGARSVDTCFTCEDVVAAYRAKNWAVDKRDFRQCPEFGAPKTSPVAPVAPVAKLPTIIPPVFSLTKGFQPARVVFPAAKPPPVPAAKPPPFEWGGVQHRTDIVGMKAFAHKELDSNLDGAIAMNICRTKCEKDTRCGVFVWQNPNKGNSKCWFGTGEDGRRATKGDGRKTTQVLLKRGGSPVP